MCWVWVCSTYFQKIHYASRGNSIFSLAKQPKNFPSSSVKSRNFPLEAKSRIQFAQVTFCQYFYWEHVIIGDKGGGTDFAPVGPQRSSTAPNSLMKSTMWPRVFFTFVFSFSSCQAASGEESLNVRQR